MGFQDSVGRGGLKKERFQPFKRLSERSFHLEKAMSGQEPDRVSEKIFGADPREGIHEAGRLILRTLKERMG